YPLTQKKVVKTEKTSSAKPEKNEKSELDLIKEAEKDASVEGKTILETGRKMALEDKLIIKGSCWNWINECFIKSGYGTNKHIAFKSKKSGPYVDQSIINPGDWLYYINHSYYDVEHSGIFVYWVDYKKKIGMILSYGGESRNAPGRYLPYDLTHVYYITRAGK
ncbi:MAG: hypothetical protein P1P88_13860, partial [Bacteroidales bacterium]|nr:hypothetical protein [Bacteroidales bacterium]